jgi:SAM-dependent methyltransferase
MTDRPTDRPDSLRERFLQLAQELGGYQSAARATFRCKQVFRGVDLENKRVLEIGAGVGVFSAYAVVSGARKVLALEPEIAGSTRGYKAKIQQMAERLGAGSFEVRADTLQAYRPGDNVFDVVLSYNSVNHLDEPMCIELNRSEQARSVYSELFRKIRDMMTPGGLLIICDCSRHNFFADLGMRNPIARTIEWHKHQSPRVWMRVLRPLGFRRKSLSWYRMYPLRKLGWLAANAVAAYFQASHFRLVLENLPQSSAGS